MTLTNQLQSTIFKIFRFPPLKNFTAIPTISLIGLKFDISFVLTNRLVVLRSIKLSQFISLNNPLLICDILEIVLIFSNSKIDISNHDFILFLNLSSEIQTRNTIALLQLLCVIQFVNQIHSLSHIEYPNFFLTFLYYKLYTV